MLKGKVFIIITIISFIFVNNSKATEKTLIPHINNVKSENKKDLKKTTKEEEKKDNKNIKKSVVENKEIIDNEKKSSVESKETVNNDKKPTVENKVAVENKATVSNDKKPTVENKVAVENKAIVNNNKRPTVENKAIVNNDKKPTVENKEINLNEKAIVNNVEPIKQGKITINKEAIKLNSNQEAAVKTETAPKINPNASVKENAVMLEINSLNNEKIKVKLLNTCNVQEVEKKMNLATALNGDLNNIEKKPILISEYNNLNEETQKDFTSNIFIRIIDNLNLTNLYSLTQETNDCRNINSFIEKNSTIDDYIYNTYKVDADFVVSSVLRKINDDEFRLEIYIWDLLDRRMIAGQYYILNKFNLKRISSIISDFVYTKTTNESKGFFDSKILYISETGNLKNRKKNIKVMNFNGENDIKITNNNLLTLTPIFSRFNRNEIYYLQYRNRKAYFYKENLITHDRSILKIGDGIVFAPHFNPQSKNQIILSMADEYGTNLYLLNNENNKYYKLTNDRFINTSPSFSPDGKTITYVSDKTGVRKLYSMDLDSGVITQVSKGQGIYDKPMWAPDERLIAFLKLEKGKFRLGIMTPDGENERFLVEGYLIEGIKWSPNSRYIIYSKQIGPFGADSVPQLYVIDILTNYEFKINTPKGEGASDPDWMMNN